jgi:hypothetical protein
LLRGISVEKILFCVVVNQFRKQIISATIAELGEVYTTFDKISNKLDISQLIATGYLGQEKHFFASFSTNFAGKSLQSGK